MLQHTKCCLISCLMMRNMAGNIWHSDLTESYISRSVLHVTTVYPMLLTHHCIAWILRRRNSRWSHKASEIP